MARCAAVSQLILEFDLERDAVTLRTDSLALELGNGVRLTTSCPAWVKGINAVKLQIVLAVDGSPPDAITHSAPIVGVHETPTDR